ncbi:AAA family ATPase [Frigoribacterium sp. CFBP9039]|nr:AAA family ATPase [Frigoribacterium sp. CFBP9039]MDY0946692.1 AAA family ATPase [Frigoribacterium sp. CFBP9039]
MADHVQVRPGFEAAVAAALGSVVDSVLADDSASAFDAIEHATVGELGRVEVVVAEPERRLTTLEVDLPPGAVSAVSVVTAPPGVLGLLASTVVADDLDVARATRAALAAHPVPATVITRSGEVLTDYVLRGGSGAERSRLELVAERDAAAERLTAVEATLADLAPEHDEARRRLVEARALAAASAAQAKAQEARVVDHEQRLGRLRARVDAAEAEVERLRSALVVASRSADEAAVIVDEAAAADEVHRARPRPLLDVSARQGLLDEVEAARAAELERRVVLETVRERVRAEAARAVTLQRQLDEQREAAERQARRTVIRQRQMASTSSVLTALPPTVDAVARSLDEARRELAEAERARAGRNDELAALRRDARSVRERLDAVTESVHGLEMELHEKRLHLSGLLDRAASGLGLVEDVLIAEYGPDVPVPAEAARADEAPADAAPGDAAPSGGGVDDGPGFEGSPFDRAEQEARLAKAEKKLARLGRVNPLALEEFAALEQRHAFLSEQLTDLTRTRADLLTIIDDIDSTMQTIFGSAFADTQAAFDRVFPILFPGGTGSLQLTDPEDLLATGIEVTVRPAGKKIERLSLLSGGERSLAAVALLIAIFKARPSPFYIMDEVEAALDDANLGRLLAIFEDLRENSQLIVITHQKRTMEIADALYGVSMRQDGVSAVVGQRVVAERSAGS